MAEPAPLCVQPPQVVSVAEVSRRPSAVEPVSMSCMLTASPRPLTTSPFSVSEFCLLSWLPALCRLSTLVATTTPLAFCHGPRPMRSRALTAGLAPLAGALR